jgi:hypothetical protein
MYHYMGFDPYLIRERNQQIFREVQTLRLEKLLRKNHHSHELETDQLRPSPQEHFLRAKSARS